MTARRANIQTGLGCKVQEYEMSRTDVTMANFGIVKTDVRMNVTFAKPEFAEAFIEAAERVLEEMRP